MCEMVVFGGELLNASDRLIHIDKHWKGSSIDNHQHLPSRGLSADLKISSKLFSVNATNLVLTTCGSYIIQTIWKDNTIYESRIS